MKKQTQFTAMLAALAVLFTAVIFCTPALAEQTGIVKGGWLILRAAPSFSGTIKSSYPSGTVVKITDQVGSWYAVTAPDGLTGYMLGDYLQINGSGGGGSVPTEANASAPFLRMYGTHARVSTLLTIVGLPQSPLTAGNGGLGLGIPRLPSIELRRAVSSPQTNAPAPSLR